MLLTSHVDNFCGHVTNHATGSTSASVEPSRKELSGIVGKKYGKTRTAIST